MATKYERDLFINALCGSSVPFSYAFGAETTWRKYIAYDCSGKDMPHTNWNKSKLYGLSHDEVVSLYGKVYDLLNKK